MTDPSDDVAVEAVTEEAAETLEKTLAVYPLRGASEDPGWAVKTVWVWIFIASGLLTFFLVLLILGFWYD